MTKCCQIHNPWTVDVPLFSLPCDHDLPFNRRCRNTISTAMKPSLCLILAFCSNTLKLEKYRLVSPSFYKCFLSASNSSLSSRSWGDKLTLMYFTDRYIWFKSAIFAAQLLTIFRKSTNCQNKKHISLGSNFLSLCILADTVGLTVGYKNNNFLCDSVKVPRVRLLLGSVEQ